MRWLGAVYDFFCEIFLGCRHNRLTRPFTIESETYEVCLDCGHRLFYSPELMRPLRPREVRRLKAVQAGRLKVIPFSTRVRRLIPGRPRNTAA